VGSTATNGVGGGDIRQLKQGQVALGEVTRSQAHNLQQLKVETALRLATLERTATQQSSFQTDVKKNFELQNEAIDRLGRMASGVTVALDLLQAQWEAWEAEPLQRMDTPDPHTKVQGRPPPSPAPLPSTLQPAAHVFSVKQGQMLANQVGAEGGSFFQPMGPQGQTGRGGLPASQPWGVTPPPLLKPEPTGWTTGAQTQGAPLGQPLAPSPQAPIFGAPEPDIAWAPEGAGKGVGSVPPLFQPHIQHSAGPTWGQQAQVNAIQAQTQLSLLLGPAGAALAKDLVKPDLDPSHPMEFKVQFPRYLEQISLGAEVPDTHKLSLLSSSLPQAGKDELQRRIEEADRNGGKVSYLGFWNWVCQEWGQGDEQTVLREELKALPS